MKILKKFTKHFLELDDNIIDKNMQMYLSEMEFTKRKQFSDMFRNMKQVIAKYYTDGDMAQATILLEGQKNQIGRFDLFVISFLTGLNIAIIAMMMLYIHYFMDDKDISEENRGIFWRAI